MNNPSLFQSFEASVRIHSDRPAVVDGEASLTFAELDAAAREVGAGLMALGVERGDRVAIWGVNSLLWMLAGLGLQAAGAALVPLGTRLRGREVSGILEDSGARIVFTDAAFGSFSYIDALLAQDSSRLDKIIVIKGEVPADASDRIVSVEKLRALGRDLPPGLLDERIAGGSGDDLADILFTSGTTGRPKGVPMTQRQSLAACEAQQEDVARFTSDDVFAVTYPFAHNAGYRAGWQIALLHGVKVVPVSTVDAGELLRIIETEKVSFLPTAPPTARALIDHPDREETDLSSLRIISTGGTTVPVKLIEDMSNFLGDGTEVQTGYGLTETAGSVTCTLPDDPAKVVATTIGRPLKKMAVKIVGPAPDYPELATGERGEIAVKGEQVMTAYYNNPEATAKAFTADGFLLTGDAAWVDEDGNYHITDRIKDMYLVGGFNCYPAEIEHIMHDMDGIAQVAIIGVDDERLGQVGRAFIVREPGSSIDERAVIAWCKAEMANYKVPRSVHFMDALPVNATGKVSKNDLRTL